MTTSDAPVRMKRRGITWTVTPSFAEDFARLDLDWCGLAEDPRAHVVKEGPARVVYNFNPGRALLSLFIKEYRRPTWFDDIRFIFRRSTGRMEWDVSRRLGSLGINVPEALALGERRRFRVLRRNLLITRAIERVKPLDVLVERSRSGESADLARRRGREFGRFIRRVHDAGVLHRDLHAGNILMGEEDGGVFYLTDLHDVVLRSRPGGLTARERFDNLVLFNGFWRRYASRTARRRFLAAYEEAEKIGLDPKALERESLVHSKAFWSRRNKRCMRENKYFGTGRAGARRYVLRRGWDRGAILALMDASSCHSVLKDGRTTRVEVHEIEGPKGACRVVVKRYKAKGACWAVRHLLRASRGLRSWRLANALMVRGIPTAAPVAAWELRTFGILRESAVVCEWVDGCEELAAFMTRCLPNLRGKDRLKARASAAERLGRVLAALHERGFSHRDLKATNVLVKRSDNRVEAAYLIDLDGLSLIEDVSPARRVKDLSRLARSMMDTGQCHATDGLRLIKAYLGLAGHRKAVLSQWWNRLSKSVQPV